MFIDRFMGFDSTGRDVKFSSCWQGHHEDVFIVIASFIWESGDIYV